MKIGKLVHEVFRKLEKMKYYSLMDIYEAVRNEAEGAKYTEREVEEYLKSDNAFRSNDGKYMLAKLPSLLLVGNSPNLIERYNAGAGWNRLLKSMEGICETYLGNTRDFKSFPQRIQAVCNLARMLESIDRNSEGISLIVEELKDWFNEVGRLQATPIHRMLASMGFDTYLTTNYDLALERALGEKITPPEVKESDIKAFLQLEHEGQVTKSPSAKQRDDSAETSAVTHIHGIVTELNELVMTPGSYAQALENLKNKKKNSDPWISKFCESEVHICGLNLGSEETLVWYALEERTKRLYRENIIQSSYPRAYVYLFYDETEDEKDYRDKCATRDLLKTYAVNTILVPVYHDDYISAWKRLIGEMALVKSGNHLSVEPDDDENEENEDRIRKELEDNLKKIEYGHGRLASRYTNMTTAFISHYMYPYCCLMSMSGKKQEMIVKSGYWLCYCKVDGERRMYSFVAKEIKARGCATQGDEQRGFLLDYRSGKLYEIQKDKKTLEFVCCGNDIVDMTQFCRMIYSEPKNGEKPIASAEKS